MGVRLRERVDPVARVTPAAVHRARTVQILSVTTQGKAVIDEAGSFAVTLDGGLTRRS
jgi:hypothetical protein